MPAVASQEVLHRKAQQGTRKREAAHVSPSRALRLSLARAANEMWKLAVVSQGIQHELADSEQAQGWVGSDDLILVLLAEDGTPAIAVFNREIVGALLEVQTLGIVNAKPMEPRPFTRTDAELAWMYAETFIGLFVEALEQAPLARQVDGYRFGMMVETPQKASLFLDAPQYNVFSASIDMASGARQGDIKLILPVRDFAEAAEMRDDHGQTDAPSKSFRLLPMSLDVILCRLQVPLHAAVSLKEGDVLDLPATVLDGAELLASQGHLVARGKLGQVNGFRAVRISGDASPRAPSLDGGEAGAGGPLPNLTEDAVGMGDVGGMGDAPGMLQIGGGDADPMAGLDLPEPGGAVDLDLGGMGQADMPAMEAGELDLGGMGGAAPMDTDAMQGFAAELGDFPELSGSDDS